MLRNVKLAFWVGLLFISALLLTNCGGGGGDSGGGVSGAGDSTPATSLPTPATITSGLNNAIVLANDPSFVYWAEIQDGTDGNGTITVKKMGTTGGPITTLTSSQRLSPVKAWGMAVDAESVYWIESSKNLNYLNKVGLNGGTVTELIYPPSRPRGLAIDSSNIYFTESNGGTVSKIGKNSGTVTTLVSGQNQPRYIAVNSTDVFWVNDTDGTINKVDINGGIVTTIASVTMPAMQRTWASLIIAVDSSNLYFIDNPTGTTGTINKVGLNGGVVTTLWSSPTIVPDSIAIDSTDVYWSGGHYIYKVGKNGGTASQVHSSGFPCFIATDAAYIYFTDLYSVSKVAKW